MSEPTSMGSTELSKRAVELESTEAHARAVSAESADVGELAESSESTVAIKAAGPHESTKEVERAAAYESTEQEERAKTSESTEVGEQADPKESTDRSERWRSRIVATLDMPAADLIPNPLNPRTHPKAQHAAMAGSLDVVGWVSPVIWNRNTARLVDGHLRVEMAAARGETVPVSVVDLSEEEERLVLATFDPIGAMAGRSDELFAALVMDLRPDNSALAELLVPKGGRPGATSEDAVPEPPSTPISVRGDVWQLGAHRIMCGDSTSEKDVAILMNGELAKLMATDPPYLVDYRADGHPQSYANKPPKGGVDKSNKQWDDYVDPTSGVAFFAGFLRVGLQHCEEHTAVYQWHADRRLSIVSAAWDEVGLLQHQVIQWVKSRPVLTRNHYMVQHEPAMYGWVKGNMPKLKPPANAKTVWEIDQKGEQDGIHPTQKPVEIFRRPIEYHTLPGDLCYEPFSGSGTCIIAAETTSRRCYAMEISPQFVDVAVRRWEEFTGQKAVRLQS